MVLPGCDYTNMSAYTTVRWLCDPAPVSECVWESVEGVRLATNWPVHVTGLHPAATSSSLDDSNGSKATQRREQVQTKKKKKKSKKEVFAVA